MGKDLHLLKVKVHGVGCGLIMPHTASIAIYLVQIRHRIDNVTLSPTLSAVELQWMDYTSSSPMLVYTILYNYIKTPLNSDPDIGESTLSDISTISDYIHISL